MQRMRRLMMENLIRKEIKPYGGLVLNQFLTLLYWIVALLTLGFIVVFVARLFIDAKDTLNRFRKRIVRARQ